MVNSFPDGGWPVDDKGRMTVKAAEKRGGKFRFVQGEYIMFTPRDACGRVYQREGKESERVAPKR